MLTQAEIRVHRNGQAGVPWPIRYTGLICVSWTAERRDIPVLRLGALVHRERAVFDVVTAPASYAAKAGAKRCCYQHKPLHIQQILPFPTVICKGSAMLPVCVRTLTCTVSEPEMATEQIVATDLKPRHCHSERALFRHSTTHSLEDMGLAHAVVQEGIPTSVRRWRFLPRLRSADGGRGHKLCNSVSK